MRRSVFKYFCYLVIALQAIVSVASAQGLMLCIHSDGASRVEDQAQQRACAEERQQRGSLTADGKLSWNSSTPDDGCVDMPMASASATLQASQATQQLSNLHFFAALPAFLQVIVAPQLAEATPRRFVATETATPNTVLDSLGSVVLVI